MLEMKCPQLSKPEATAARNENSIGDRMEKKPWEKVASIIRTFRLENRYIFKFLLQTVPTVCVT